MARKFGLHVLEHVYNSRSMIEEVSRILAQNGEFVFSVPNYNSISARMRRADDYPRHVYFFTIHSLKKLFHECGLKIIQHETRGDVFPISVYGVFEFQMNRLLGRNIHTYLHTKRNRSSMAERTKQSVKGKILQAKFLDLLIKAFERTISPAIDLATIPIGIYGTLNVRAVKSRQ